MARCSRRRSSGSRARSALELGYAPSEEPAPQASKSPARSSIQEATQRQTGGASRARPASRNVSRARCAGHGPGRSSPLIARSRPSAFVAPGLEQDDVCRTPSWSVSRRSIAFLDRVQARSRTPRQIQPRSDRRCGRTCASARCGTSPRSHATSASAARQRTQDSPATAPPVQGETFAGPRPLRATCRAAWSSTARSSARVDADGQEIDRCCRRWSRSQLTTGSRDTSRLPRGPQRPRELAGFPHREGEIGRQDDVLARLPAGRIAMARRSRRATRVVVAALERGRGHYCSDDETPGRRDRARLDRPGRARSGNDAPARGGNRRSRRARRDRGWRASRRSARAARLASPSAATRRRRRG